MKKEIKLILVIVMIITIFVFDNRIIAETLSKKEAISHNGIDFFRKQIGGNNAYSISGVNVTAPLSSSEEDGPTNWLHLQVFQTDTRFNSVETSDGSYQVTMSRYK